ncbi:hypothetical protein LCGC14_2937100 [marine sediment metagenome]|uniref:Uncharacterized protein n=1 Tax=marine sediment metagenome TaxID=412755 RepID=A0A0F8XJ41_9ZZZZ
MVQYASRKMEDWLANELNSLKDRVTKLEAEEAREAKEGTIRPGTKRGRKPKN